MIRTAIDCYRTALERLAGMTCLYYQREGRSCTSAHCVPCEAREALRVGKEMERNESKRRAAALSEIEADAAQRIANDPNVHPVFAGALRKTVG